MRRTQQSVGLFLFVCVFWTPGAQTAQDSPQQNISLTWVDGMYPEICWLSPPEKSVQNSIYEIYIATTKDNPGEKTGPVNLTSKENCTSEKTIMSGGFVQFHVKGSKPTVISDTSPVLVNNWDCVIRSSSSTYCSWEPTSDAPEKLHFFYILRCANCDYDDTSPIQECPSYTYTGKIRTGCNLQMNTSQSIRLLFNGTTVDHKPVRNTYIKVVLKAKLPPLNWTVTKTENMLNISWIPPDVFTSSVWSFTINYTRCDQSSILHDESERTYWTLPRESSCRYRISIQAKAELENGETEWSQEKIIEADSNLSVFAAVIIPLVLAVVVVLTLVCCRKNKENIFPKVPVPRDLLSDISNNNKITVGNLYSPGKEEEDCKITLVIDPQINKQDA